MLRAISAEVFAGAATPLTTQYCCYFLTSTLSPNISYTLHSCREKGLFEACYWFVVSFCCHSYCDSIVRFCCVPIACTVSESIRLSNDELAPKKQDKPATQPPRRSARLSVIPAAAG